jgi:hypothetical protein
MPRANQKVSRDELKSIPLPKKIVLTNFEGENVEMIFYNNSTCFEDDIIKFIVGGKETYLSRDELLTYLLNAYVPDAEDDLYSEEEMEENMAKSVGKPTNPRYQTINNKPVLKK